MKTSFYEEALFNWRVEESNVLIQYPHAIRDEADAEKALVCVTNVLDNFPEPCIRWIDESSDDHPKNWNWEITWEQATNFRFNTRTLPNEQVQEFVTELTTMVDSKPAYEDEFSYEYEPFPSTLYQTEARCVLAWRITLVHASDNRQRCESVTLTIFWEKK